MQLISWWWVVSIFLGYVIINRVKHQQVQDHRCSWTNLHLLWVCCISPSEWNLPLSGMTGRTNILVSLHLLPTNICTKSIKLIVLERGQLSRTLLSEVQLRNILSQASVNQHVISILKWYYQFMKSIPYGETLLICFWDWTFHFWKHTIFALFLLN